MSYEIVRSINTKTRMITAACNNLRPLHFEASPLVDDNGSTEDFIKRCLVAFDDGDFRSTGDACWKFDYAIMKFNEECPELAADIHKKRWENYDYATQTYKYTKHQTAVAYILLKEKLYEYYQAAGKLPKGNYVIEMSKDIFITKLTAKGTYRYTLDESCAKHFSNEGKALSYLSKCPRALELWKVKKV